MKIKRSEYERLKAAEDTCWSLMLAITIGVLEAVPVSERPLIGDSLDKWAKLAAEQGLMHE
jgi:hypothetical protein